MVKHFLVVVMSTSVLFATGALAQTGRPKIFYSIDVSGNEFKHVVHSGQNVVALTKVFVDDDGENAAIEPATLGLYFYGPNAKELKAIRLFGPRDVGESDEFGPQLEWEDWEGAAYTGFGLFTLDEIPSNSVRLLIVEGDEKVTPDEVIFNRVIDLNSIPTDGELSIHGTNPDDAEIWLRLYPTFPPEENHSVFSDYSQTRYVGGSGGIGFRDPVDDSGEPKVLVGLHLHYWNVIDMIQPIFRRVNANGSLGSTFRGLDHGGDGGGKECDLLVPDDYVVTGLGAETGEVVGSIYLRSKMWLGDGRLGDYVYRTSKCGNTGRNDEHVDVKDGSAAVGIWGRSGRYLDAIGLIQGTLSSAPETPSKPLNGIPDLLKLLQEHDRGDGQH